MEFKLYVTVSFSEEESDWKESDWENPEEAFAFLVSEFEHRVYHMPGGAILDLETK